MRRNREGLTEGEVWAYRILLPSFGKVFLVLGCVWLANGYLWWALHAALIGLGLVGMLMEGYLPREKG